MTLLKTGIAGLGMVALWASSAIAIEVRQVAEIKAAPAAVWDKVGGWCAIKDWHPAVAGCDASKKGFRTLTLKDGGKIVEKLTKTGKYSYSYEIIDSPLPVKNYSSTLTAKPDSLGTTDLVWTAKFDPAKGKTAAEAAAAINGVFEGGLKNIKDPAKFDALKAEVAAAPPAAATVAAAAASKDEARMKAREERQKRLEQAKLVVLEKAAKAKAQFAKLRAELAEKAKSAADAAKVEYEKAKAAIATMTAKPKT